MDKFVKHYQPDKFKDWKMMKDIAPHPMDPPEVAESKCHVS